jgi:5'-nucleotidase
MSLVLVTNDDGIYSPGLTALYEKLKGLATVYVVAPDRERSAVSHSLTMHKPLRVQKVKEHIYAVNGTPTDCVAIGASKVLPEKPTLIVSGINIGANLGDDITYSGTVSAAIEGTILNIPSFAVSLVVDDSDVHYFETAAEVAAKVASYILEQSLPYDTLLNVNVPNKPVQDIAGVKFTRQGKRIYEGAIHETYSPWGEKYYWIGGGVPYWEHGEDTDINAVQNGYVSITPIHLDLTNYNALDFLKERWEPWISKNSET